MAKSLAAQIDYERTQLERQQRRVARLESLRGALPTDIEYTYIHVDVAYRADVALTFTRRTVDEARQLAERFHPDPLVVGRVPTTTFIPTARLRDTDLARFETITPVAPVVVRAATYRETGVQVTFKWYSQLANGELAAVSVHVTDTHALCRFDGQLRRSGGVDYLDGERFTHAFAGAAQIITWTRSSADAFRDRTIYWTDPEAAFPAHVGAPTLT